MLLPTFIRFVNRAGIPPRTLFLEIPTSSWAAPFFQSLTPFLFPKPRSLFRPETFRSAPAAACLFPPHPPSEALFNRMFSALVQILKIETNPKKHPNSFPGEKPLVHILV